MSDMSAVIAPKSDQINADDLIAGPMTIQITGVKVTPDSEQPVSISFAGSGKVYRPCKSMSRVLVAGWGADAKNYVGKSLTLYRDPSVKWGGLEVGGIRISHMSDLKRDMVMSLTMSKANRKPHQVKVLQVQQPQPQPEVLTGPVDVSAACASARDAAKHGTETFRKWWTEHPDMRAAVKPIMAELQGLASAADADPFGLPATDPSRAPVAIDDELAAQIEADLAARNRRMESGE